MNSNEYNSLYKFEGFYWWYVARRKLIREFIHKHAETARDQTRILDVGCGTGMNHSVLEECGEVYGTDQSESALRFSRMRGIENLRLSPVEKLDYEDGYFQLVTALDILEHTDDDLVAIRELHRVVQDGGQLLVTVPAYGFLWSEHDEALQHRRRYTEAELCNKLTASGFKVERCTYFIMLLFFPILIMRIAQNLGKQSVHAKTSHIILPKWLNQALIWILDLERLLLRGVNLPFGVSLVCMARKVADSDGASENLRRVSEGQQPVRLA